MGNPVVNLVAAVAGIQVVNLVAVEDNLAVVGSLVAVVGIQAVKVDILVGVGTLVVKVGTLVELGTPVAGRGRPAMEVLRILIEALGILVADNLALVQHIQAVGLLGILVVGNLALALRKLAVADILADRVELQLLLYYHLVQKAVMLQVPCAIEGEAFLLS